MYVCVPCTNSTPETRRKHQILWSWNHMGARNWGWASGRAASALNCQALKLQTKILKLMMCLCLPMCVCTMCVSVQKPSCHCLSMHVRWQLSGIGSLLPPSILGIELMSPDLQGKLFTCRTYFPIPVCMFVYLNYEWFLPDSSASNYIILISQSLSLSSPYCIVMATWTLLLDQPKLELT